MITIGDLIDICRELIREYGPDGNVIIQIRDETGEFISGDYCFATANDDAGNLYLTNNPPKLNKYTS